MWRCISQETFPVDVLKRLAGLGFGGKETLTELISNLQLI